MDDSELVTVAEFDRVEDAAVPRSLLEGLGITVFLMGEYDHYGPRKRLQVPRAQAGQALQALDARVSEEELTTEAEEAARAVKGETEEVELVTVANFETAEEGAVLRELLESAGIPVSVWDELSGYRIWVYPTEGGWGEIRVPWGFEKRAREVLAGA